MTEIERIRDLEAQVAELRRHVMTSPKLAAPSRPFSIKDAAHQAGKSEATIRRWCKNRPTWAFKVGGMWKIDCNKFIAAIGELVDDDDA